MKFSCILLILLLCLVSCILISSTTAMESEDFDVLDEYDEEASVLDSTTPSVASPNIIETIQQNKNLIENNIAIEDEQQLEEEEAEFQRNAGKYVAEEVDSDILA